MKKILALFCLLTFANFAPAKELSSSTSAIPPKIPVRDFFKNPESRGYLLSPDGKTLSYLAPWESRMNIWVRPTAGGEAKRITSEKDRDIRDYFWKGNQFVIYSQDNKGDENFHLFRVDLKSGEIKDLTPFPKVRSELIDDLEDNSETDILVTLNKRNPELFDAMRVNVATGEMKVVAENPGHVDHWVTDHKGRILAATETDGVNATLLTRPDENAPFKKVLTTKFPRTSRPAVLHVRQQGALRRVEHRPRQTGDRENRSGNGEGNRDDLSKPGRRCRRTRLFEEAKSSAPTLATRHGRNSGNISIRRRRKCSRRWKRNFRASRSTSSATITTKISSSSRRPAIARLGARYLYNAKSGELTKLAEVAPWLKADQLAPMKPIEYKSRDGLTIHGYLTLPVGREAKNLPVVVNPHGGPWARDAWGLQSRSAVSGQSRLRRFPDELPRLDRIRPQVLGSVVQAMGQDDAG